MSYSFPRGYRNKLPNTDQHYRCSACCILTHLTNCKNDDAQYGYIQQLMEILQKLDYLEQVKDDIDSGVYTTTAADLNNQKADIINYSLEQNNSESI